MHKGQWSSFQSSPRWDNGAEGQARGLSYLPGNPMALHYLGDYALEGHGGAGSSYLNPVNKGTTGCTSPASKAECPSGLLAQFPVTSVCVQHLAHLLHHLIGLHGAYELHDLLTCFLIYITASVS